MSYVKNEHKEANQRIAYQAKYASDRDENKSNAICKFADDLDIYILLCNIAYHCRSALH